MNNSNNKSSRLDGFFENARNEQPVINLNEVSDLLKNPSAYQRKKESNTWKWFGAFLLIGLSAMGIFFLFNNINNSSAGEKELGASVAPTTNITSDVKAIQSNNAASDNQIEASKTLEKNDIKKTSSESSLAENSKEDKGTIAGKPVSVPMKPDSKTALKTTHYAGDANISFSSGDKKIKMIISPSNEVEELKIDDELISDANYKEYKNIIDEGLKLKNEKLKSNGAGNAEEQSLSSAKRNIMNAMIQELSADGLVSPDKPFDFTLTGHEVILDNQKQSPETFEKYKGVYEKVTGEKLPAKYNLHIKR